MKHKILQNKRHNEVVHVVPIGFEEDRAVYGFINLSANRIYLLTDEKEGAWGEEARRHADAVKKRLNQMAFDGKNIISVYFDPTDFESSKNCYNQPDATHMSLLSYSFGDRPFNP